MAMSQGMHAASTNWKSQGNGSSHIASRRKTHCWPVLDFWCPELKDNKFLSFEGTELTVICYSSIMILRQLLSPVYR